MKVIIAPDSFKGSCSAIDAAGWIAKGVRRVNAEVEIIEMPIADGGEGTIDAIAAAMDVRIEQCNVCGPYGEAVTAQLAFSGDMAIIEMAKASGIMLAPLHMRDIRRATSYGTGELIKKALDANVKRIIIGIGGSATNDGGAGALAALGVRFIDDKGDFIDRGGAALAKLCEIDLSGFDRRIFDCEIIVACDVGNPLIGPNGASAVYGPQKGADSAAVAELDSALSNFAQLTRSVIGEDFSCERGAGAAGGMGFALMAYCGGKMASGIDTILDILDFEGELCNADLVISGEGKVDSQSMEGKAVAGIARRAMGHGVAVAVIGGAVTKDASALYDVGVTALFGMTDGPITLEQAMADSEALLEATAENIIRLFLAAKD